VEFCGLPKQLSLYSDISGLIGSITGADLSFVKENLFLYTVQININSDVPFDYAVASGVVFEFDNLSYHSEKVDLPPGVPNPHPLPEGGPAGVLLAVGIASLGLLRRRPWSQS
jgi:hypothetical protein